MHLDSESRSALLEKRGMKLDLGGIAKGYAADRALAVLKSHGVTRSLVAAGGDIAIGDPPPNSEGWTVSVPPPDSETVSAWSRLSLKNCAVSTSGDDEQHVVIGGRRYSHIVDPRTGMALSNRVRVTVIAPKCVTSDSLATAASVLGTKRGLELIESVRGAAALVFEMNRRGRRRVASKHWVRDGRTNEIPPLITPFRDFQV
jgi:thiamine biosynthesis lipoprotein